MLSGESGIRPTSRFDASTFPTTFGADSLVMERTSSADLQSRSDSSLVTRFALNAVREAWKMSGMAMSSAAGRDDLGVYFAAGEGYLPFDVLARHTSAAWRTEDNELGHAVWTNILDDLTEEQIVQLFPQHTLQRIACEVGAAGYVSNCFTACAAGLQAIGEATELIRLGEASVMIAGGANSTLHPLGVSGFNRLGTLSTRNELPSEASRPFDLNRDGFVLGEGAGAVVLESLEHAVRRNATILAEVVGYGSTSDAYRVTDQHPESDGLIRAMQLALHNGAIDANEVDYLNAHGTSTVQNDRQETLAIHAVFGQHAKVLPISSIKSMIGHLLTAAGAVEFVATVLAIRDQVLPPTINLAVPDPECDLNYIPNKAIRHHTSIAMTVNLGFGGLNDAVVLRRYKEENMP